MYLTHFHRHNKPSLPNPFSPLVYTCCQAATLRMCLGNQPQMVLAPTSVRIRCWPPKSLLHRSDRQTLRMIKLGNQSSLTSNLEYWDWLIIARYRDPRPNDGMHPIPCSKENPASSNHRGPLNIIIRAISIPATVRIWACCWACMTPRQSLDPNQILIYWSWFSQSWAAVVCR